MTGKMVHVRFNEKGASSVLVMLVMIVLVVFGLAALTASLSVLRLGEKAYGWTREYYQLDAMAEEMIYEIDKVLSAAEETAARYIEEKDYMDLKNGFLPEDIRESIYSNYIYYLPEQARGEYLSRVFKAVFYKEAVEALEDRLAGIRVVYNGGYFGQVIENENFTGIWIEFDVSEDEGEFAKHIEVGLKIIAPEYKIVIEGGTPSGERVDMNAARYEITGWREWQNIFDYSRNLDFAEPEN
ncbi:MAG: hypothetical protein JXB33_09920 [Clostridia bacterium]|nr:hypothetical protein [Clostridia bacterium]